MNYTLDDSFRYGGGDGGLITMNPEEVPMLWINPHMRLVGVGRMSAKRTEGTSCGIFEIELPREISKKKLKKAITGDQFAVKAIDAIIKNLRRLSIENSVYGLHVRLSQPNLSHSTMTAKSLRARHLRKTVACERHADLDSPEEVGA